MRPISSASELLWNADSRWPNSAASFVSAFVDLLERDLAVDARLAQAEQVQVGTVEQKNMGHGRRATRKRGAAV